MNFQDDISINNILGSGSTIKGDLSIRGFAKIDGCINGNLEVTGNLIIGKDAKINGNVSAKSITVGGIIKGNIIALESVHLLSTCVVLGDVQTKRIQADENVIFHGHCISISNPEEYEKAVSKWNNISSVSSSTFRI